MSQTIPWRKSLGAKLGVATLTLLVALVALVIAWYITIREINNDIRSFEVFATGSPLCYKLIYLTDHAITDEYGDREKAREAVPKAVDEADRRFAALLQGDPEHGVVAFSDPSLRARVTRRNDAWESRIKPFVGRLLAKGATPEAKGTNNEINALLEEWVSDIETTRGISQALRDRKFQRIMLALGAFVGLMLAVLIFLIAIGRGIVRRAQALAATAERISAGELGLEVGVGGEDELAAVGKTFNAMTASLRQTIATEAEARGRTETLLAELKRSEEEKARLYETTRAEIVRNLREAVARLTSATTEILASTTQQAAGAQEQAAAVGQTVTTVDEVTQTAEQAAKRAKGVGEAVQRNLEIGEAGRRSIEESIAALNLLREKIEATAENILTLAEQAQAIGEIIATVNDIAEQTNILALNAAIEASRAGEQGRGFAVVAGEVKSLADQSKKATQQVRQILGEIQKSTNTAVLSTEEVTKGVASAIEVGAQSGRTINALAEALSDAASASAQIVASAGQQATGMSQISQAMKNLDQVARQNLVATRQVEQAAQNLNSLGTQLAGMTA